jgi:hypothetical protein
MLDLEEYNAIVTKLYSDGYKHADKKTSIPNGSLLKIVKRSVWKTSWVVHNRSLELEWSMTDRQHRGCLLSGDIYDFFLLGKALLQIDDNEHFEAVQRLYYKVLYEDKVAYINKNEFFYENSELLSFVLFYKTP